MKLSSIHIGERSRRAMTGIESLAASIEKVGLLHPPAVPATQLAAADFPLAWTTYLAHVAESA